MNWKALVAAVIILVTVGLMALTDAGREYATLLGKSAGSLIGYISKNFLLKLYPQNTFNFELTANGDALRGQTFPLSNSSLTISGQSSTIKMDGRILNMETANVEIEMKGDGDFVLTPEGGVSLNVKAKAFKVNNISTDDVKVEIEIVPTAFAFDNTKKDLINITSASGTIVETFDSTEKKVTFTEGNLEIDMFSGAVQLINESVKLSGTATSIKVDGKSV
jgi:hypothetical protein